MSALILFHRISSDRHWGRFLNCWNKHQCREIAIAVVYPRTVFRFKNRHFAQTSFEQMQKSVLPLARIQKLRLILCEFHQQTPCPHIAHPPTDTM